MKKEDLFEAMQGIDDDLIARSERKTRRHHGFRNFVIIAAAAACLGIFLMSRGIMGSGGNLLLADRSSDVTASSEVYDAEEGAPESSAETEDTDRSGGPESLASADSQEVSAEDQASAESQASAGNQAETGSVSDEGSEGTVAYSQSPDSALSSQESAASSKNSDSTGRKTSADLLGDLKGDYVKVEYASASGGSRKEAVYSDSGAAALSRALSGGSATLKVFAKTGKPIYYAYLVKADGSEDTVTFYENDYVSMTTYKGFVMEVSDSDYQAVLALFR